MAETTKRYYFYSMGLLSFPFGLRITYSHVGPHISQIPFFLGFWIHSVRYAVVTGGNKGIGLETARQLASSGIKVVLTARDEKRGLEALGRLKSSGLSELLVFHQLDVADSASVASLAQFIKSQFGKLDILVTWNSNPPLVIVIERFFCF